ncbi:MucBP domain-containing protein [Levilactobacillus cerevisiae]|uniref:MucBP domain-containing protein n=1 Tax=Levilactobacillus cerevisiae TaxID=1704076 RepID=UPI000F76D54F|nr:MucBP domain-containing protein [Levilactobacillus cerevisiae]
MFKRCGETEHYKMYKKGKTWIFAGILTSFFMVTAVGTETAYADTVDDSTSSSQQVSGSSESQKQQVPLKSGAATEKSVGKSTTETSSEVPDTNDSEAIKPTEQQPSQNEVETPAVGNTPETPKSDQSVVSTPQKPVEKPTTVVKPVKEIAAKAVTTIDTKITNRAAISRLRSVAPTAQPEAAVVATPVKAVVQADQSIDEWMPNKALQQAVFKTLTATNTLSNPLIAASGRTWSSVSDITQADMALLYHFGTQATLTTTYIDGKSSFSLEGLQYATNLTYLDLKGTMNLIPGTTVVNYWGPAIGEGKYNGDITDISQLAGLTKLTFLQLASNRITDVTPLAGLKNLTTLQMPYNYVSDFSSLNYAQYTGGISFDHQLILNDPVVVSGMTRTYTTPITIKWPQNFPNTTTSNKGYAWMDDTLTSVYSFEPAGVGTNDGNGNIVYTGIQDQVMPGSSVPLFKGYTTTQLPYKYYLSQVYFDSIGIQYFSDYTPYTIGEDAQTVTVHYQDTAGKAITTDKVLDPGMVGETYTTEPLVIKGYTLKETPANATGTYGTDPIDVIYVYSKDNTVIPPVVTPTQTITVTVHYQTADGTTVAPDVTVTGKAGDAYTTSPAANVPAGYKLVTTPSNASGTLGDSDFTVTYVYAKTGGDGDKVVVKPTTPTKPSVNPAKKTPAKKVQKSGQADTVTGGKQTPVATKGGSAATVNLAAKTGEPAIVPEPATAKATLPQTNDTQTSPLWGIAVLGALLGLVGYKRRKN